MAFFTFSRPFLIPKDLRMSINALLAKEQVALIRARFAPANPARDEQRLVAWAHGEELQSSLYPHVRLRFELLA